jgi:hypothetical protein
MIHNMQMRFSIPNFRNAFRTDFNPIDHRSFQRSLITFLLKESGVAIIGGTAMFYGYSRLDPLCFAIGTLAWCTLTIVAGYKEFWRGGGIFYRRIRTIYPQVSKSHPIWFSLYWLTPLLSVGLCIFLLMKPKMVASLSTPVPFSYPSVFAIVGVLALVMPIPGSYFLFRNVEDFSHSGQIKWITYFLASPAGQDLGSIYDEAANALGEKERVINPTIYSGPYIGKQLADAIHSHYTTGRILGLSLEVMYQMKRKDGISVPKFNSLASADFQIEFLEDILVYMDATKPSIRSVPTFNPISALSPPGVFEISLVQSLEFLAQLKFKSQFSQLMDGRLKALMEKTISEKTSERLKPKIIALKAHVNRTLAGE